MQTAGSIATNLDLVAGSRGRGRKNADGTQETVKIGPLKTECPKLMRLLRRATEAQVEYKEALTAVCERNGANTATINKLLKASLKGNYEDVRQKVEQLSIVFEEIGEVSDAGA